MIAATNVGFVNMRVSKVVGLAHRDGEPLPSYFVVLDELDGDRQLVIQIGAAEAFALTAGLNEMEWHRPMTYQLTAELVRRLGGRIREVRLDGIVEGSYAATVEVEGPLGTEVVDARSSDGLNLAVLVGAPIVATLEVLDDCGRRREGESSEAVSLQRALTTCPLTITSKDV
jgi:uncharacterized protein